MAPTPPTELATRLSWAPFALTVTGAGAQAVWTLRRTDGVTRNGLWFMLWFLRLLAAGLMGLIGYALYARGHAPLQVAVAILFWALLVMCWRFLGLGLGLDGVSRLRLGPAGQVTLWRRTHPRRETVRCTPEGLLSTQLVVMHTGELGTQRWLDVRLQPDARPESLYLGFLALPRHADTVETPGEDAAVHAAVAALAAHLGVRCAEAAEGGGTDGAGADGAGADGAGADGAGADGAGADGAGADGAGADGAGTDGAGDDGAGAGPR